MEKRLKYDIYDKSGNLLLAKGQFMTVEAETYLTRVGLMAQVVYDEDEMSPEEQERLRMLTAPVAAPQPVYRQIPTPTPASTPVYRPIPEQPAPAPTPVQTPTPVQAPNSKQKKPTVIPMGMATAGATGKAAIKQKPITLNQALSNVLERRDSEETLAFQQAYNIVNEMIFHSKNANWYNYLAVLTNYLEWLYSHSINTALLSCIMGIGIGYNETRLVNLALGAILHDIGMTLLPKNILDKPAKLTDVEMAIVRNHCDMGYSMLDQTSLPKISKLIILQHHERNDGTGYPQSLTAEQITEEAKIVSIAESFDTATTERPYKKAVSTNIILTDIISKPEQYDLRIARCLSGYILGE